MSSSCCRQRLHVICACLPWSLTAQAALLLLLSPIMLTGAPNPEGNPAPGLEALPTAEEDGPLGPDTSNALSRGMSLLLRSTPAQQRTREGSVVSAGRSNGEGSGNWGCSLLVPQKWVSTNRQECYEGTAGPLAVKAPYTKISSEHWGEVYRYALHRIPKHNMRKCQHLHIGSLWSYLGKPVCVHSCIPPQSRSMRT